MRRVLILLIAFACSICVPDFLFAQQNTLYFAWTMGVGTLFYPGVNEQMRIRFPYTVTDASGNTTSNTFNSKAITPYRKPGLMFSAFNWELGNVKHFVIFRLSGNDNIGHVSLGYGRSFYFDFPGVKKRGKLERTFTFKPSLNISYFHYGDNTKGADNYLGDISNQNNTVHVFGKSSGPTFSWTDGGDNPNTFTDSTQAIGIFYVQNAWAIIPKLSISTNQHKHILYGEASIGYYVPVYSRGGLTAYQNDWNKMSPDRPTSISTDNISTTINNKSITAAPYRFSGVFVDFTLGICLSKVRYAKHPH